MDHSKTTPTNPIFQKVKQTLGVQAKSKECVQALCAYIEVNLTSNVDQPIGENLDDFNNIVFNDPKEETNDVEEFDGEFVNLEEANRISCARKKRRRHSSDYATNTIEENDDNDVEYHSKELESEPESDEEGNVIEKEKFPPFVPQSSMAIKMGCWFII